MQRILYMYYNILFFKENITLTNSEANSLHPINLKSNVGVACNPNAAEYLHSGMSNIIDRSKVIAYNCCVAEY